ncbi:MAG TPA: hypothetical protein ENN05_04295 [Deltaproteobacteria bacterium]|nr:hypothetical protein [Deltaproteobacteria bacterium]
MLDYAGLLILPLIQVLAIVLIVKKLRGTKSLFFGVLAVVCWLLSFLVPVFFSRTTSLVITSTIVASLSLIGWLSFLGMLLLLPSRAPTGVVPTVDPDATDTPKAKLSTNNTYFVGRKEDQMSGQQAQNNEEIQVEVGMIAEGFYPWFLGGVLLSGTVVVPIVTAMLMEGISPAVAWIGGIISAAVFLLCLDKRGNWRETTAFPAIGVAVVGATIYHYSTGRPIWVVGGLLGFVIFAIFGALGVVIGKLVRAKS